MLEYYVKKSRNVKSILILSIMRRVGRGTPEQKTRALELDSIAAVNTLLLRREISEPQAEALAKAEVDRLRAQSRPPKITATINQEIAQRYWNKAYLHRPLKSPESAYNRIMRGVKALGALPLPTATSEEIMNTVAKNVSNNTSHRTAIDVIASLLLFIGRTEMYLYKPKAKRPKVKFVTIVEFRVAITFVPTIYQNYFWTLFGTGGRVAEGFGVEIFSAHHKAVYIETTVDRILEEDGTKTGETRWAPVIAEAVPHVKAWIATDEKDRNSIRNSRLAEIFGEACVAAGFEYITCQDIRHSYAIYLLSRGKSIEQVARALGNSVAVCQRFYLGFVLKIPELEAFSDI